jgi:uncharacterized protein YndB with AHSA1/START domain
MTITHLIEIAAPIQRVWEVTTDVEQWPRWSPTVQSLKRLDGGPFMVGSRAEIKQPAMPRRIWQVIAMTDGQSFSWQTELWGMRLVGMHELTPTPTGCTSHLQLEIAGAMSIFLTPMLSPSAKRALRLENEGLKTWCEQAERPVQTVGPPEDD